MEDLLQQASTSFAEESANATLQKWEDRFVRLLIEKYGEYKHLFGKPKTSKKGYSKRLQAHLARLQMVLYPENNACGNGSS